jgi:hypothetical protein
LQNPKNITSQIGIQWEGNAPRIFVSGDQSLNRIDLTIEGKRNTVFLSRSRPWVVSLNDIRPALGFGVTLTKRNGTKKRLTVRLPKYATCEELNKVFLGGVSLSGLVVARIGDDPTIKPTSSGSVYMWNRSLDFDNDQIACER